MISQRPSHAAFFVFVTLLASPASALVFDDQNGTGDYNDAVNWESDTIPGTVGGEEAVIGRAGSSGGVSFANPVTVTLGSTPLGANPIGGLVIGSGPDGDGVFEQSGGDLTTASGVSSFLGVDGTATSPSAGEYVLSGDATFSQSNAEFHLGIGGGDRDGIDLEQLNFGTLRISDDAVFNGDEVFVGSNDQNFGRVFQSQGVVNVGAGLTIGHEGRAVGYYEINGGALNSLNDGITVGEGDGATGVLQITLGATVNVSDLRIGRGLTPNGGGGGSLIFLGRDSVVNAATLSVGADDGVLTDGRGTVVFSTAEDLSGELSQILVAGDVTLNDGTDPIGGGARLRVRNALSRFAGLPSEEITLIDVGGALIGEFVDQPEGSLVRISGSGVRTISYQGGDGNDIVLLPYLPGDADSDSDVDGDDLIAVQANFGGSADEEPALLMGDADNDGDVDGDDLIAVQSNFGATLAVAVPAPASAALLLAAGIGLAARRR